MRLQISHGSELELIIPRGYELKEAEKFLLKKADWIKKHLAPKVNKSPEFLFLGKELEVRHEYELFAKNHQASIKENELCIISPAGSSLSSEVIYDKWLKQIGRNHLVNRAYELANKYNIEINRVTIRGQKTRWGSCSTRGNLSFNYKLMRYNNDVIDYVIIHELCHRREMNHSKKFWALVAEYCPEYKKLKKELRGGIY